MEQYVLFLFFNIMDDKLKGCIYISDFGIYKVYCDFFVLCIIDVEPFKVGDILKVSDVRSTKQGKIAFLINGAFYYHSYFTLYFKRPPYHQSKKGT